MRAINFSQKISLGLLLLQITACRQASIAVFMTSDHTPDTSGAVSHPELNQAKSDLSDYKSGSIAHLGKFVGVERSVSEIIYGYADPEAHLIKVTEDILYQYATEDIEDTEDTKGVCRLMDQVMEFASGSKVITKVAIGHLITTAKILWKKLEERESAHEKVFSQLITCSTELAGKHPAVIPTLLENVLGEVADVDITYPLYAIEDTRRAFYALLTRHAGEGTVNFVSQRLRSENSEQAEAALCCTGLHKIACAKPAMREQIKKILEEVKGANNIWVQTAAKDALMRLR
ncbi:MAG: hypothetical protein AAFP88_02525 [Bacteroidota bacterium]